MKDKEKISQLWQTIELQVQRIQELEKQRNLAVALLCFVTAIYVVWGR